MAGFVEVAMAVGVGGDTAELFFAVLDLFLFLGECGLEL